MGLYPLKFQPLFVDKMWGGRKIETVLGKTLPPGLQVGESWELYDLPPGAVAGSNDWISSKVANGPLAGRTLHSLVQEFGTQLQGDVPLVAPHGQFPILIKYLDARDDLSVQVHPDQKYCDAHPGTAYLKTEAWYVLQHDAGAKLYKGLKRGTTREQLRQAIQQGTVEQYLTTVSVQDGQCFYLPSGTVHALGRGILVAEVQTPSDTTFRVFDFNRIDPATGQVRSLHVDQAMECIDFSDAREPAQPRTHVAGLHTTVSRLVTSPFFTMEKVRFREGVEEAVPYDQPVVWMMLSGEAEIRVKDVPGPTRMTKGDTVLVPAKMNEPIIKTLSDCVWLETTFPTKADVNV
jgi:mannose-6-phosphate isomerase